MSPRIARGVFPSNFNGWLSAQEIPRRGIVFNHFPRIGSAYNHVRLQLGRNSRKEGLAVRLVLSYFAVPDELRTPALAQALGQEF